MAIACRPNLIAGLLLPDMNPLQGAYDPGDTQQPENHGYNHDGIEDFLYDGPHRYIAVDNL